jgi:hypothetical protein
MERAAGNEIELNCDKKLGSGLFQWFGSVNYFSSHPNSSFLMATDTSLESNIIALHLAHHRSTVESVGEKVDDEECKSTEKPSGSRAKTPPA